jgi:23S rRNA (uridine2552-2'-O)-methyltransferase
MARTKSSNRWLQEHFSDFYVKEAQRLGYRSRAVFKLLEIQERDKLIKSGTMVVDLGAAPGGWSQMAAQIVGAKGGVIALDILPMEPLDGVEFIKGDFTEPTIQQQLTESLQGRPIDLVICDIAPNMSGNNAIDQPRVMYLVELVLEFVKQALKPQGTYLVKIFQGEGFEQYLQELRKIFTKVVIRKPKASRDRSPEVYLLATGKK